MAGRSNATRTYRTNPSAVPNYMGIGAEPADPGTRQAAVPNYAGAGAYGRGGSYTPPASYTPDDEARYPNLAPGQIAGVNGRATVTPPRTNSGKQSKPTTSNTFTPGREPAATVNPRHAARHRSRNYIAGYVRTADGWWEAPYPSTATASLHPTEFDSVPLGKLENQEYQDAPAPQGGDWLTGNNPFPAGSGGIGPQPSADYYDDQGADGGTTEPAGDGGAVIGEPAYPGPGADSAKPATQPAWYTNLMTWRF